MASRKGVAITIAVLVGVAAFAYSLPFLIPEDVTMKIIVSDFEEHLDITKEKALMEVTSVDESFEQMINDEISPNDYISIAEVSSSQINSQIIELVESEAGDEWFDSYLNNLESLRKYNSYIMETIVLANLLNDGNSISDQKELVTKIEQLKQESIDYANLSLSTRP